MDAPRMSGRWQSIFPPPHHPGYNPGMSKREFNWGNLCKRLIVAAIVLAVAYFAYFLFIAFLCMPGHST